MDLMRNNTKFKPGQIHINRDTVNGKTKSISNNKEKERERERMRKLFVN